MSLLAGFACIKGWIGCCSPEMRPQKRQRGQGPKACHPFFSYLMQNRSIPIAKRQGTDMQAVVPWIISDHMLPEWDYKHLDASPPTPALTAEAFARVLMSRGAGFRSAGREALYTKKDSNIGLECVRQRAFLLPKGDGAWKQLLDDCLENWAKVYRHAHPEWIPGEY